MPPKSRGICAVVFFFKKENVQKSVARIGDGPVAIVTLLRGHNVPA